MTDFDAKARTWDADPAKVERARRVGEAIERIVAAVPGTRSAFAERFRREVALATVGQSC